jgi:hypothetical protein
MKPFLPHTQSLRACMQRPWTSRSTAPCRGAPSGACSASQPPMTAARSLPQARLGVACPMLCQFLPGLRLVLLLVRHMHVRGQASSASSVHQLTSALFPAAHPWGWLTCIQRWATWRRVTVLCCGTAPTLFFAFVRRTYVRGIWPYQPHRTSKAGTEEAHAVCR